MKSFRAITVLLLFGFILSALWFPPARAQEETTPEAVILEMQPEAEMKFFLPMVFKDQPWDSIFGIEMSGELATDRINPPSPATNMSNAGATWVRRNALLWSAVEPSPGQRNWPTSLDAEMINADKHHLRQILIIRSTPPWAQQYTNNYCGPIKWSALDEFANFMRDTVARYSKDPYNVKYYELWNEPDIEATFFTGDNPYGCWGNYKDRYYGGGYYADMLKYVYPAIKQANPNAQVLVGGLLLDCDPNNVPPNKTDCNPSKFLEGILSNGGGPYFDGVSFHAYDYFAKPSDPSNPNLNLGNYSNSNWWSAWNTTGPVLFAKSNFIRNLLNQYGYSQKYVINTEVGLICGNDAFDPHCEDPALNLSFQNTKAYYVVQAYAYARWLSFKANIWFNYFGWRSSGLWNANIDKPEAAYNAYDFASQKISRASAVNQITTYSNVKGFEFMRSNQRLWILWYTGGDPANGTATTTVDLPNVPSAIWRWVKVGSGTANDGTYQPEQINQAAATSVVIGRAPLIVEFVP